MNDNITTEELVTIVNKALHAYHNTPVENYPLQRGIDRLDDLLPVNSKYKAQAYDWYMQVIDSLNK